ncbi:MAG: VOC family protein [Ignavibacteriae bacterium]|nr:VOC family protein [Ignavibacteriota bacterium]MCB9215305.1 VOC family protein [Ignavibacteria bacterium]
MSRVVHFEIMADNPEKVLSFYSSVFGWQSQKWEGPEDYWLIITGSEGQGINGGLAKKQEGGPSLINVVDVESVDEFVAKVEAAGGSIAVPKMAIPGVGWLAYGIDPEGTMFGMMQSDESAA